jgi:hypothetical protein
MRGTEMVTESDACTIEDIVPVESLFAWVVEESHQGSF